MTDRSDRAFAQLQYELFGSQGHRRGCFTASATIAFEHLSAWMAAVPQTVQIRNQKSDDVPPE